MLFLLVFATVSFISSRNCKLEATLLLYSHDANANYKYNNNKAKLYLFHNDFYCIQIYNTAIYYNSTLLVCLKSNLSSIFSLEKRFFFESVEYRFINRAAHNAMINDIRWMISATWNSIYEIKSQSNIVHICHELLFELFFVS